MCQHKQFKPSKQTRGGVGVGSGWRSQKTEPDREWDTGCQLGPRTCILPRRSRPAGQLTCPFGALGFSP